MTEPHPLGKLSDVFPEKRKRNQIAIYMFLLMISVYLISISWPDLHFIDQHQQRFEVTRSIVERFDLSIPEGQGITGIDGRDYSLYGLGSSVMATPFFLAGKSIGKGPEFFFALMNPLVAGATVSIVLLFSLALGYSTRASIAVAILYGTGTFAWPLSKQPFDHVLETFFVLFSIFSLYIHVSRERWLPLILSAASIGIALTIRLTSSLVLPALVIMMASNFFRSRPEKSGARKFLKKTVVFFILLVPFVGMVMWYNLHRFGSPFETGFQILSARTGLDFFGGTPFFLGLKGFLFSPGKGFFYFSPIAIFFLLTIRSFHKRHPDQAVTFMMVITFYVVFLSKNVYWHGDWSWGPRYLLPITPLLILPIAELLDCDRWKRKDLVVSFPVYAIFAFSLAIQIAAVSVHFYNYFYYLQIDRNLRFSKVEGEGVPPIYEPPPEVHFDWEASPILYQFRYMKRIGTRFPRYQQAELPSNASFQERARALPTMNVFDFWWAYMYTINGSAKGFAGLLVLLLSGGISGLRLVRLSNGTLLE